MVLAGLKYAAVALLIIGSVLAIKDQITQFKNVKVDIDFN